MQNSLFYMVITKSNTCKISTEFVAFSRLLKATKFLHYVNIIRHNEKIQHCLPKTFLLQLLIVYFLDAIWEAFLSKAPIFPLRPVSRWAIKNSLSSGILMSESASLWAMSNRSFRLALNWAWFCKLVSLILEMFFRRPCHSLWSRRRCLQTSGSYFVGKLSLCQISHHCLGCDDDAFSQGLFFFTVKMEQSLQNLSPRWKLLAWKGGTGWSNEPNLLLRTSSTGNLCKLRI